MPDNTQGWLDIMPRVPLVEGVPVVPAPHTSATLRRDFGRRTARLLRQHGAVVMSGNPCLILRSLHANLLGSESSANWRVNLATPQGYAHALTYLFQRADRGLDRDDPMPIEQADAMWQLADELDERRRLGKTTNADRLRLAQALADLVPQ